MGDIARFYPKFFNSLGNKEVDVNSDVFKLVALSSSYAYDATDQYYTDLSGELSTGSGYTAGGLVLSSVNFDLNTITGGWRWRMTCAALSLAGSTFLCRHLAVVNQVGSKPLVGLFSFRDDTDTPVDKMPQNFAANAAIGGIFYIDIAVPA